MINNLITVCQFISGRMVLPTGLVAMWKHEIPESSANGDNYQIDDYNALLHYVNQLASHKLGYPVSLLTYVGIVSNQILGINPGTLANILLNNVGDPFKDSETSLLEVKKHERKIISILEKYYGLAEGEARGYVTTGGTEGNFGALWWSKRYVINKSLDTLIRFDDEVKKLEKKEQELTAELATIATTDYTRRMQQLESILQTKNLIIENKNIIQQILTPTVLYSKGPTHYSIPKISEILKLNIRGVVPNADGSMNLENFNKELLIHLGAHPYSPVIVIANIGTTITGAIDNVPAIKKILDARPTLNYTIHMDGALTGFVLPIIQPFGEVKNYLSSLGANTLAVSAHKYPGLSQPCGILLAEKEFFDKAFEKSERSIDYVGNIQDVTITGSRSGLNVLMFYNALCTLGLDKDTDKLRTMVAENMENAKYLYQRLVAMYGAEKVNYLYHFNVNFPRPTQALAKKYQLMLTGETATICVLSNVTKPLIDQFLQELKSEKESIMQTNKTDYKILNMQSQHVKAAVDLITKDFCDNEPITKILNIRYHDFEPFAKDVIQKAVIDGLSKVIVDNQNRLVACAIAEDIADPFVPHLAHYPKFKPIFALLSELSKPFVKNKKFIKGKIVHIWLAAVDTAHHGQGLSTEIEMASVENAARRGFDFAYAEFTNKRTEKVTHHFKGAQMFNQISYQDFALDGEKPFASLTGVVDCFVAPIRPGVNLNSLSHCYKVGEKY